MPFHFPGRQADSSWSKTTYVGGNNYNYSTSRYKTNPAQVGKDVIKLY